MAKTRTSDALKAIYETASDLHAGLMDDKMKRRFAFDSANQENNKKELQCLDSRIFSNNPLTKTDPV